MIDVESWMDESLVRAQRSQGDEWTAECPACGRWGKFYVNVGTGKWVCLSGKCGVKGRQVWTLIALVEGITPAQARSMYFREGVSFRRRKASPLSLAARFQSLRGEVEDDVGPATVEAPMPDAVIKVYDESRGKPWRFPRYLKNRGMKRETAAAFGLGFTKPGVFIDVEERDRPLYIGERIFIPVVCPSGYSWTARAFGDGRPKYLNAPGADHGRLLHGWDHVGLTSDVVLAEGEFDSMALHQNGLPALALGGKQITDDQLGLLFKKPRETSVTIMLDPEAASDAHAVALKLSIRFSRIFIAQLPDGVDPGSASRSVAWKAYDDAPRFSGNRATGLRAKMGGLTPS